MGLESKRPEQFAPRGKGYRATGSRVVWVWPEGGPELPLSRFDSLVSSDSHSKAGAESISGEHRQDQFPSARPGTFILAPLPRLSTSWSGVIASDACDDHAKRIIADETSSGSPVARPR